VDANGSGNTLAYYDMESIKVVKMFYSTGPCSSWSAMTKQHSVTLLRVAYFLATPSVIRLNAVKPNVALFSILYYYKKFTTVIVTVS
jgi:hypothetical protein